MATIRQRGDTYQIRVSIGYTSEGKQVTRSMTWTPPEGMNPTKALQEAERQAVLFEEQIRSGLVANGKIKFADFAEMWMKNHVQMELRPRTIHSYAGLLRKVNERFGHIPIENIRPAQLLEFYTDLANELPESTPWTCKTDLREIMRERKLTQSAFSAASGVSETTIRTVWQGGRISADSARKICNALSLNQSDLFRPVNSQAKISNNTILHYHRLISDVLSCAVRWQYIPYNPCDRVSSPKVTASEKIYLDDEGTKRLLRLLKDENPIYRRATTLLLLTGMRRGELMGLEWRDVDFQQKTIRICRTSQYLPGTGVYTDTTKNATSTRLVYVPESVLEILREQYAWQLRQKNLLGELWQNSDRIITDENGTPMNPDRLTQWFGRFVKRVDLPKGLHLHSLRHIYASLCIAQNVPLTAVAAQLGHSNMATTATIYAHPIRSAQIKAAQAIGGILEILADHP